MNRFVQPRPYADPEAAMRKILELANAFTPIQDARIYIEAINGPMIFQEKATPAESPPLYLHATRPQRHSPPKRKFSK